MPALAAGGTRPSPASAPPLIFSFVLHAPVRFTSWFCFPRSGWYLLCAEQSDHSAMNRESKCIILVFSQVCWSLFDWIGLVASYFCLLAIAPLLNADVMHFLPHGLVFLLHLGTGSMSPRHHDSPPGLEHATSKQFSCSCCPHAGLLCSGEVRFT
jgi:hypothetical protein